MNSVKNQLVYKNQEKNIQAFLKRLDQIPPKGFGNKIYKLKYNLLQAKKMGFKTMVSFGGAYSNHIAALAKTAKTEGIKAIGIIRGEELGENLDQTLQQNPTLALAAQNGMELIFISRASYRQKNTQEFKNKLLEQWGPVYILPEGGSNEWAVKGCEEIISESDKNFDYICCPVGTGGTVSGIIRAASPQQKVLGYLALKADLSAEIERYVNSNNWKLIKDYHFGGFAKINKELVSFINTFTDENQVVLDPIYTGKMMFGIFKDIENGFFKENSRILAVHTGGLQGIEGMNQKLIKKKLPVINYI